MELLDVADSLKDVNPPGDLKTWMRSVGEGEERERGERRGGEHDGGRGEGGVEVGGGEKSGGEKDEVLCPLTLSRSIAMKEKLVASLAQQPQHACRAAKVNRRDNPFRSKQLDL
mmetsp:Transcript_46700/g.146433  ORF Transcript_46700/g.146433 Transcript_46700/m.146433 type:complete len:114 (+) Transcript_46700:181-522(+)